MSNILKKAANIKLLSIIIGVILAAAIALGTVCGLKGWGIFNKDILMKNSQNLTVSVNQYVYSTDLEKVENECEKVLDQHGVVYEMKGEMSGDVCEIVYVFNSDVNLDDAKAALETRFAELTKDGGEWEGSFLSVALNKESVTLEGTLAEGVIVRGLIAAVVFVALVFAYVAIRYGLFMGIVSGVSTAVGALLTAALIVLTRIPVTASAIYVLAISGLLTAVMSVISLNKIRESKDEEMVFANNEIVTLTALMGAAIVLVGAVATPGVRWFALLALLALVASALVGLVFVPALYAPFKKILDNKPVEGAYVGAEKTSTKVKKLFTKAAPVEETKAAPAEEAPVEESEETVEETEEQAEELVEEEVVEELVEEEAAEEVVEETTEEVAEEEKQD